MTDRNTTRRRVLKSGVALGAAGLGISVSNPVAANPGKGNGKEFGRVYANDDLWRTNVVKELDERPDPEDKIYFLHDGEEGIVDNVAASDEQESPFVSESAPGDKDWTGGKWTHFSAEVTDVEAFNEDAPLTNDDDVLDAAYVDVTLGRPTNAEGEQFGPPDYFICPLNGKA